MECPTLRDSFACKTIHESTRSWKTPVRAISGIVLIQQTEQENFVFTDYEITVEEAIKNNTVAPIQVKSAITVTRDGGVIKLNNRVFRAKRDDFDPPLVGQRYLLFLRFIPATGAYLAYGNGTFQLEAQKVVALGPAARDEMIKSSISDPFAFLSQVCTFATSDCQPK